MAELVKEVKAKDKELGRLHEDKEAQERLTGKVGELTAVTLEQSNEIFRLNNLVITVR